MDFFTDIPEFSSDLLDEIKLFFPCPDECGEAVSYTHTTSAVPGGTILKSTVTIGERRFDFADEIAFGGGTLMQKRLYKRAAKLAVYRAMRDFTGYRPPWGSLTGIRPSKLVYDMLAEEIPLRSCAGELRRRFDVSDERATLITEIVGNQEGYYTRDDSLYNLYIHIPFCATRCSYCSFAAEPVARVKDLIPAYVKALRREIEDTLFMMEEYGSVHSVYVGGGTPTSLSADELYELLRDLPFAGREFTVEAGRPDSITAEKAEVMAKVGVNRVCVNPQTLDDDVLRRIGRAHTAADFFEKYALVKSYGFDVNVDLIAGLPGDAPEGFARSLCGVAQLRPENITVHTLARKNGSELKCRGGGGSGAAEMVDFARRELRGAGYIPYYLYRQKQMTDNLENVGYCLPGKQCANNVTTMEECISVVGCGAGAISKAVISGEKRIVRFAGMRDVRLYLERYREKWQDKQNFCRKQFTKIL